MTKHVVDTPMMTRGAFVRTAALASGALLSGGALTCLNGCLSARSTESRVSNSSLTEVPMSTVTAPYDWSNLTWVDGFPEYRDSDYTSEIGVDVSEHQGFIDWAQVAAEGITFAFIRVGNRGIDLGYLEEDDYYSYNLEAAAAEGLTVGAYFYSQAISVEEAQEEALYVIDALSGYDITGPVGFDYEVVEGYRIEDVTSEEVTAIAQAFCELIAAAGYQPLIYGNARDLNRFDDDLLDTYPLWLAEYTDYTAPSSPLAFTYWQFCSDGLLYGIDTFVDLNLWMRKK